MQECSLSSGNTIFSREVSLRFFKDLINNIMELTSAAMGEANVERILGLHSARICSLIRRNKQSIGCKILLIS